jgi:hypothetical protein
MIPMGRYCSFADFAIGASELKIADFTRAAGRNAHDLGQGPSRPESRATRLLANIGVDCGQ